MPRIAKWRDDLIKNDPYVNEFFFVVRDRPCKELGDYLDTHPETDLDHIYYGMNSLAIASRIGDIDKVKLLADRGANIYLKNSSAVYQAVSYGHIDIFKYLCEIIAQKYGKEELRDTYGSSLYTAVKENDFQFIEYLLEQGADPNYQRQPRDLRPIDWARTPSKNLDAFLYMLPLTTPRYRKTAMKNMEFFGFDQSMKRAKSEEEVLRLRSLRERYDDAVSKYKATRKK